MVHSRNCVVFVVTLNRHVEKRHYVLVDRVCTLTRYVAGIMSKTFAPKDYKSRSLGTQQNFTTIPWRTWYQQNEPTRAKYLLFTDSNGEMKDVFHGTTSRPSFDDSLSLIISGEKKSLILLDGEWHRSISAHNFLNSMVPSSMQFYDGAVGVWLFRQLQSLLMSAVGQVPGSTRDKYMTYIRELVTFIRKLEQNYPDYKTTWFGTTRVVVENNTEPEDILPFMLASGVLGVPISRDRLATWLHLSLRRSLKHGPLCNNALGLVVWRFTTGLINNTPDKEAMESAFESLLSMKSFSDLEIVNHLLHHVLPELQHEASTFLVAVKEGRAFYPSQDVVMQDGSVIQAKLEVPLDMACYGGLLKKQGDRYAVVIGDYNKYVPLTFKRPEDKVVVVTVFGHPVKAALTCAHGPGIVVRTTPTPVKDGRDFIGKNGLTLRGGRGTGRGAPTEERKMPGFMVHGSTDSCELCSVCFDTSKYSLSTPSWETPLTMAESQPYCSIFVKGVRDVTIQISVADSKRSLPEQGSVTQKLAGVCLSDMRPLPRHSLANLASVMSTGTN